jgi:FxsC-like protein
MATTFFFSYARHNQSPYLEVFTRDLATLLRGRTGRPDVDLVFIDREIEPGTDWTRQIREALRTCQVFFSLESPAYFQSEYCGKEWSVFRGRIDNHARALENAPSLHFRLPWMPLSDGQLKSIPSPIQKLQDARSVLGDPYTKDGFEYLIRRHLEPEYQEALTRLVDRVIEAMEKYPLPSAADIPDLGSVASAFALPQHLETGQNEVAGVGHIRLGVIAAAAQELPGLRKNMSAYGSGAIDWKPFFPAVGQRIGAIAQRIAASQDLTSDFLKVDDTLAVSLTQAEQARNIVVFLVDPWALEISGYHKYIRSYDEKHCLNCSLLIPWPSDDETQDRKTKLFDRMRAALARTAQREPGSYREEIDSLDRLESELIKAITNATARMIELVEVTRRIESNWAITMPLLSGPAGGNDAR